jgi:hypothetical protein
MAHVGAGPEVDMKAWLCMALVGMLAVPAVAGAEGLRPWLGLGGSFNSFSMGDVNDDIAAINASIAPLAMDEMKTGFGFGGAFGLDLAHASLTIAYERLLSSSEIGDASGSLKYDFPANVIDAQVTYLAASERPFSFGAGGSVGRVSSAGSVRLALTGSGSVSGDLSGSGPVAEAFGAARLRGAGRVSVVSALGYRYAKIRQTKVNGSVITNPDGSNYSLDYSGLIARVMLKIALH